MESLLGYARVSTLDQNPELQIDALKAAGCGKVFTDHASGAKAERPQLTKMLEQLRSGDTVVVWKLDRLGRSLKNLIELVQDFEHRGVAFKSITENIDTSTPTGRFLFHLMGALGEMERELIRERTMAGLAAAVARGHKGGRPTVISPARLDMARKLRADGRSHREIGEALNVGASRCWRMAKT
jgi:DNA invertase Pin-like site-specific DNA recombinase